MHRTWDQKDQKEESSSPGRCTHVVFLRKALNSHNASLHPPMCVNGNQQITWGQTGGVVKSGGVEILLVAYFILQKPVISSGTDEPSRCISIVLLNFVYKMGNRPTTIAVYLSIESREGRKADQTKRFRGFISPY